MVLSAARTFSRKSASPRMASRSMPKMLAKFSFLCLGIGVHLGAFAVELLDGGAEGGDFCGERFDGGLVGFVLAGKVGVLSYKEVDAVEHLLNNFLVFHKTPLIG